MTVGDLPFRIDWSELLAHARRQARGRIGNITISLPFVSFSVSPKDQERKVAREMVIRLRDRRVLSARECCDDCIDRALASLSDIRKTIVDKQVELSDVQDGPLFLLLDAMGSAIRQFMTFEEHLRRSGDAGRRQHDHLLRPPEVRHAYFDGLEVLRGHLSRCLAQIAAIGGMPASSGGVFSDYKDAWQLEAYMPGEPTTDQRTL